MLGINIGFAIELTKGVPVPREPFSFAGTKASKFGDFDITADGGVDFFTFRRKITAKWTPPKNADWMS